jgi:hypothetical protein
MLTSPCRVLSSDRRQGHTNQVAVLQNTAELKLGIKLMKNKAHPEGKGVAVKLVEEGGQAVGKVAAGQVITHVNGTHTIHFPTTPCTPPSHHPKNHSPTTLHAYIG